MEVMLACLSSTIWEESELVTPKEMDSRIILVG